MNDVLTVVHDDSTPPLRSKNEPNDRALVAHDAQRYWQASSSDDQVPRRRDGPTTLAGRPTIKDRDADLEDR